MGKTTHFHIDQKLLDPISEVDRFLMRPPKRNFLMHSMIPGNQPYINRLHGGPKLRKFANGGHTSILAGLTFTVRMNDFSSMVRMLSFDF